MWISVPDEKRTLLVTSRERIEPKRGSRTSVGRCGKSHTSRIQGILQYEEKKIPLLDEMSPKIMKGSTVLEIFVFPLISFFTDVGIDTINLAVYVIL